MIPLSCDVCITSVNLGFVFIHLQWSQATQLLASGSDDGVTIVWNVDGSLLARLEGHTGAVNAVQWSPAIGAKSLAS